MDAKQRRSFDYVASNAFVSYLLQAKKEKTWNGLDHLPSCASILNSISKLLHQIATVATTPFVSAEY